MAIIIKIVIIVTRAITRATTPPIFLPCALFLANFSSTAARSKANKRRSSASEGGVFFSIVLSKFPRAHTRTSLPFHFEPQARNGRGDLTRTGDLCVPNAARYQLCHAPVAKLYHRCRGFSRLFCVFYGAGFADDINLDGARIRHRGFNLVGNITGKF